MLVPNMDWAYASPETCVPDLQRDAQAGSWPDHGSASQDEETIELPFSPDDPRFAQVYRFIGDVFAASDAVVPVEAHLQRLQLQGVDPLVLDTVSASAAPTLPHSTITLLVLSYVFGLGLI
jgi:hypothetical protein